MNVRTWLAVSVYMVIVQAFVALTDGVGPHTGERCFKCGHNFLNVGAIPQMFDTPMISDFSVQPNLGTACRRVTLRKCSFLPGMVVGYFPSEVVD